MTKKPQLVIDDPWLEAYTDEVNNRIARYNNRLKQIKSGYGSLLKFADGYKYLGIHFDKKAKGWWYREWAPAAKQLYLIGDFNGWNRSSHPLKRIDEGVWEIFVPGSDLKVDSKIKVHVVTEQHSRDRIPAYIFKVEQANDSSDFVGLVHDFNDNYKWTDSNYNLEEIYREPLIYEAHIGLAREDYGVGTYTEFKENTLPRIKKLGYNVLQLMAIQEHPYYGSFGYHVSNFFAPSGRFGTPEELKDLVNAAHNMGMAVIIDLVHSHSVKNISEGINDFDGSGCQYFHEGGRGNHDQWDSKLFNYGKTEVLQFLLSNVKYWMQEFHVDGFRFDGVTSMLYFHHGNIQFDHYDRYFRDGVEWDAIIYLQLANTLIHQLKKNAISIAEDMSGMPGLCRQVEDGGVGFDFRLGMGIPDFWIKYLKEKRDEDWNIHEMWSVMSNRRWKERTIAYAESHDQSIVGDKTVAFWLMDKEMYYHMSVDDNHLTIERGIALHKLIRLFTASLGGEGYLNFIGNEFGHPEWVDFPREGNNWSYHYARRQWSLVDNESLKYKYLNAFDVEMVDLLKKYHVLSSIPGKQINMDENNKAIIFERANLVFLFNFSTHHSIPDYQFYAPEKGNYKIILNSDNRAFGGHDRVDEAIGYPVSEKGKLSIYLPNRTAIVLAKSG